MLIFGFHTASPLWLSEVNFYTKHKINLLRYWNTEFPISALMWVLTSCHLVPIVVPERGSTCLSLVIQTSWAIVSGTVCCTVMVLEYMVLFSVPSLF